MTMDDCTARMLNRLTTDFYRTQAASFAQTRHTGWAGWGRVAGEIARLSHEGAAIEVLDVGCGNLRFERCLCEEVPGATFRITAVDNCPALSQGEAIEVGPRAEVVFCEADVVSHLIEGGASAVPDLVGAGRRAGGNAGGAKPEAGALRAWAADVGEVELQAAHCGVDVAVAFGVMHHVPGGRLRAALLEGLLRSVRPGGLVAVSFWCFSRNEDILAKAQMSHRCALDELAGSCVGLGQLEPGDYLMGWQGRAGVYRYCHDFSDADIDELAGSVVTSARVVARYSADGRTGNLNEYVILQRT